MNQRIHTRLAIAATALALTTAGLAGCAADTSQGRRLERAGRFAEAYECYAKALGSDVGDSTAAAGLKRTAPPAVEYWRQQATAAAEAGQWQQAAQCHRKALQIQPNEPGSILSLRDIARRHPQDMELAWTGPLPSPHYEAPPPDRPTLGQPTPLREPAPPPVPRAVAPPPAPRPAAPPAAKPSPIDPNQQQPGPVYAERASSSEFIQVDCLSTKDRRYLKTATWRGGLSVLLKGTDHRPERADLEFYLGKKKIARLKKLIPDDVVSLVALDGIPYEVVVMSVLDKTETVTLGLRQAKRP